MNHHFNESLVAEPLTFTGINARTYWMVWTHENSHLSVFLFKKAMASPTLLQEVPPWQLTLSPKYESCPGCPSSQCLGLPKTPRGSTSVNPLPTPASQHPPLRPRCTGSLSTEDTWAEQLVLKVQGVMLSTNVTFATSDQIQSLLSLQERMGKC